MQYDPNYTYTVGPNKGLSLASVIEKNVEASGECLIWTGLRTAFGYGRLSYRGAMRYAHRVVATLHGLKCDRLVIRHKCDNPSCVNPLHLQTGTQADNIADAIARGRNARGEMAAHKLTEDQVREIRTLALSSTHQKIADAFGISRSLVTMIVQRKRWRYS